MRSATAALTLAAAGGADSDPAGPARPRGTARSSASCARASSGDSDTSVPGDAPADRGRDLGPPPRAPPPRARRPPARRGRTMRSRASSRGSPSDSGCARDARSSAASRRVEQSCDDGRRHEQIADARDTARADQPRDRRVARSTPTSPARPTSASRGRPGARALLHERQRRAVSVRRAGRAVRSRCRAGRGFRIARARRVRDRARRRRRSSPAANTRAG